ncbi:MAG: tetracycline resistance MFS efflux pump [Chloroflexota bacterium]|nr:MFS transporter [Ardenticatenaceae bacterium]GIK57064.1 MAG: tetracycline resistance MFS efflux pump [Chloroflexota bacterium]
MKIKQVDRRLLTILLIVFVNILGASMVLPVLPLYALRRFEMPPQLITLLGASFFLAQAIASPYLGRLSDRYGRVPILIISQIGTAVSFVMIAQAQSVAMLFAARILDGITGGNIIVAQAYITDITPREKRTQSLGLVFAAFGLGFVFGPALGGLLSGLFGPAVPFYLAALAATAVVILTYFTLDETLSPAQRQQNRQRGRGRLSIKHIITNYPLVIVLLLTFVGQFALGLLQSTFALYGAAVLFAGYTQRITDLGIGLLLTVVGVTQLITQLIILPRTLKRLNETVIIALGLIVRALGLFIFAIVTVPWLGAFGSVFFALGMGLLMPPLQSTATRTVGDEVRGEVLGVNQSVVSISTIISTAVSGAIFALSPTLPYEIGALLSILTLPLVLVLHKAMPPEKSNNPATAVSD